MQAINRKVWDAEGPTWILAVAIYGAWFLLMWLRAYNREKLVKPNDNFVFSGYLVIARDYLFKPVFIPVHLTA